MLEIVVDCVIGYRIGVGVFCTLGYDDMNYIYLFTFDVKLNSIGCLN